MKPSLSIVSSLYFVSDVISKKALLPDNFFFLKNKLSCKFSMELCFLNLRGIRNLWVKRSLLFHGYSDVKIRINKRLSQWQALFWESVTFNTESGDTKLFPSAKFRENVSREEVVLDDATQWTVQEWAWQKMVLREPFSTVLQCPTTSEYVAECGSHRSNSNN